MDASVLSFSSSGVSPGSCLGVKSGFTFKRHILCVKGDSRHLRAGVKGSIFKGPVHRAVDNHGRQVSRPHHHHHTQTHTHTPPPRPPLSMARSISLLTLLRKLASTGIPSKPVGFGLASLPHPALPCSAIWQAWQNMICAREKGFGGEFCFDIYCSHQLLVSSHLRERDKMLLRAILSRGVWNGKKRTVPVGFAMHLTMMAISFGDALFPLDMELRNDLEFLPLMNRNRTNWPRCFLWHGWLSGLTSRSSGSPWASLRPVAWLASHNLDISVFWDPTLGGFYTFHLASFLGSG